ncbi:unnamed protein product [Rotaria socialis]|uniref:Uncharacterized protein n=1 Tax=Rotaria socialis TaxID=392032 RepID=A0A821AWJ1_9BILA|nr:unnamed protein product [Rotaria socialis]
MYYGEIRLYTEPNGAYTIVNGRIWTPNIYHQQQQIIAQQQLELTEQQTALGAQQQALLEEQRQAHDNEIIEMMIENMLDVIAE